MIDPDVLRRLVADLDAKADIYRLDSSRAANQGHAPVAGYLDGAADAYSDVAARIREILDNETNEGEPNG